ncbi:DUF58 domain-containing protein [Chloroflexota bacterium]
MKPGRILLALIFVIGTIGALVNGAPIYSRFVYSSLLFSLTAFIWTRWVMRKISFERTSRELRANVGDMFEEQYKLSNHGRLPALWMEVLNQSEIPFAAGSRLFTLVMAKQTRTYTARTWLTRRGRFELGPTRLTTGDPFGLFTASKIFKPLGSLTVFPMIHEIESFPSPRGLLTGGQVIRKKSSDITPHASGVREYVTGDAMKRIHWHTSARRGRLMVKEFEQDPQAEVWLYFDAQKSIHYQKRYDEQVIPYQDMLLKRRPKIELPPATLEYSVSILASLANYFLRQRRAVGYASAGQSYHILRAERGERQEAKILETLAFVKADGKLSLAGLVATQAVLLPPGSSVILVTPTTHPDLLQAVDELLRRFLSPIVVLLDAKTFAGPAGTDELADSLRARRIPVITVACGEDLSSALSAIPFNFTFQENHAWQTPELSPST